jgi:hypothetical protein
MQNAFFEQIKDQCSILYTEFKIILSSRQYAVTART